MKQQDKMILLDLWKNGTISADDQRKLELAALDDSFLFEAMEGYSSLSETKVNTTHLSEKLAARVGENTAKRRSMWLPLVGVAASLFALAFIFWWNASDSNVLIAENTAKESPEGNKDRSYASNIDLENLSEPTAKGTPLKKTASVDSPAENSTATAQQKVENDKKQGLEFTEEQKRRSEELLKDFMAQKPTVKSSKVEPKTSAIGNSQSADIELEKELEEDRIVMRGDLNAEDFPNEEVITADEDDVVRSEAADMAMEESMVVTTSVPPPPAVEMDQNEVLVSKKEKPGRAKKKASKKAKAIDFGSTEYQFAPINGWDKFNVYIAANKSQNVSSNNTQLTEKVIVEFSIDRDGNPKDIKVVESTSTSLNEDAKKLIRLGGKWVTNDVERKIKYVVNY